MKKKFFSRSGPALTISCLDRSLVSGVIKCSIHVVVNKAAANFNQVTHSISPCAIVAPNFLPAFLFHSRCPQHYQFSNGWKEKWPYNIKYKPLKDLCSHMACPKFFKPYVNHSIWKHSFTTMISKTSALSTQMCFSCINVSTTHKVFSQIYFTNHSNHTFQVKGYRSWSSNLIWLKTGLWSFKKCY